MYIVLDVIYIFLISLYLAYLISFYDRRKTILLFLAFFLTIFLHEFAHKAIANYFNIISFIEADISLYSLLFITILYIFLGILIPPPIYTYFFGIKVEDGIMYYAFVKIIKENAPQILLISLAGPLINLILGITSYLVLKKKLYDTQTEKELFEILYRLNILLFLINIAPVIPGNDGSKVAEAIRVLLS